MKLFCYGQRRGSVVVNILDEYDENPEEAMKQMSSPQPRCNINPIVDVNELQPGDMITQAGHLAHVAVVTERNWSTPIRRSIDSVTVKLTKNNELITLSRDQLVDEKWMLLLPVEMVNRS